MDKIVLSGFADEISSSLDRQIQVLKKLGISHMEIRGVEKKGIDTYATEEVKEIKGKLDDQGIAISSLASPIGKINIKDDFTPHLEHFKHVAELAHVLNTRYIRMFSFYIPEGKDPEDYREKVIEKLAKFDAIAKAHDIVLIHENEKDIYGDRKERCRVILDALGSDHFKAVFDFANFVQCGEDTMECWELLRDQVVYIHIKDAVASDKENVRCGTGEGKIKEILTRAIREEGYEGFLTLEPHLVLFDALQSLEVSDAESVIKENKAKDGAEGYSMQYHALKEILNSIERQD